MTISTLPAMPTRGSTTFSADVEAFLGAMPTFVTETNAFGTALNNLATNGTSATSTLIGTGAKTVTADTGKSWQLGMVLRLAYTTTPTNWMSGTVTAYNSGTGSLTINVDATSGSGTYAAWTISAAASGGATLANIQSGANTALSGTAGGDTITATATPTLGTYSTGMRFSFTAAADNTTAVTLNIDSLGAKSVTKNGTAALKAKDIKSGERMLVEYDGTRFQLIGTSRVAVGGGAGSGANNVIASSDLTAGAALTTGAGNTALGTSALASAQDATNCVAIGYQAVQANISSTNIGIGYQALLAATGARNTAIGYQAGKAIVAGVDNVIVGDGAGDGLTGSQNTIIGSTAGSVADTLGATNCTVIGYNSSTSIGTASNEFTLGNASIATLRCQVTTITSLSDARDKTDVSDLPLGLDFLLALRPVKFTWAMRQESARNGHTEAGFIAQELAAAQDDAGADWLGLVMDSNPDRLEASPGKLLPILVKAIQELAAENADLRARLAAAGIT